MHVPTITRTHLVVLVAAVVALNLLNNLVLGERAYVVVNLVASAIVVAWARASGMTWEHLGLTRGRLRRGAWIGAVAATAIAGVVLVVATMPWASGTEAAADTAAAQAEAGLAWTVLVRIPFGTALPEELLFRSVVLGVFLVAMPRGRAIRWSALLFGLWHVLPTADQARVVDGAVPEVLGTAVAVIAAVAVTTAAGFAFAWLRERAGSVLAPVAAHASANASALLAAHLVLAG